MTRSSQLTIKILIWMVMVILVGLPIFLYINNEPIKSAKIWYEAVLFADYQTTIALTCKAKINEISYLISPNTTTIIQEKDLSGITYKKSGSGDNFVVIDASGIISAKVNDTWYSQNTNQRWQFIYEESEWKWCGSLEPNSQESDNNFISIAAGAVIILFIGFITLVSQKKDAGDDFSQFISPPNESEVSNDDILNQMISYETGEVKSVNNYTGTGIIETDNGERYAVNLKSIIGKGDKTLNVGEDVLFQKNWESKEKKAKNIIKVKNQSKDLSPYSAWLIQLAHKTKRLRKNLHFLNLGHIQSELNTCKAFLEQLNDYARKNNVKLAPYEIVLTNFIERELNNISRKAESKQNKSSLWSRILRFVLQMLGILADFIQIASPDVALLLKSISRGVNRLLSGRKPPPSLGPGDE